MPINETELFNKYKSSYKSALMDFSIHIFFTSMSFYSLWYFRNSWLTVFTVPILGFMSFRNFVIFHDCCHNIYTPSKTLNYIIGNVSGIFSHTAIYWSLRHNTHHATSVNKDNSYNYHFNETIFHTVHEYKKFGVIKKIMYKLLKNPIFFFGIISFVYFILLERISVYKLFTRKLVVKPKLLIAMLEQTINNIGVFMLLYMSYKHNILCHYLLTAIVVASSGFMLFHNEHTFNPSYVVGNDKWSQRDSGLSGSSFIQIPWFLKYFTMGIEYHHIHHMNAKIPGYNLQAYHIKLSMTDCYNNLWLVLYDEEKRRYITFSELDNDKEE
jgi:omega-6 fatty acid desaturase (delta-12 desaturase)